MSELKDRLLKQLETDYSEDARGCLKIYEAIKKLNGGSIPSDQWMVLSRVQYLGTHTDSMRVYSPSEIGYIFLKGLEKDNEMKVLSITEVGARMIYSSISGEFKKKLEDIFGIERLTLSFQDLVKTYEDACEITGSVPDIEYDDRSELARLKLIQIYKASNILNDNWKLTPLGTQCAFYRLLCGRKVNLYAVIYVILYTVSPMILNYVAEKKMMLFT